MSGPSLHRESLIALLGPVLVWPTIVVTHTDYAKYAQPRLLTLTKTENLLEHGEDHPHGDESLKTGSETCLTATAILEWEIGCNSINRCFVTSRFGSAQVSTVYNGHFLESITIRFSTTTPERPTSSSYEDYD